MMMFEPGMALDSGLVESTGRMRESSVHPSLTGARGGMKRALDIVLSISGLTLLGPLLALLAWLIRRESPGPALYRQIRLGQGGREFVILKLRTMHGDAERYFGPAWAVEGDPRCTRLGGVLRRWGIDELPQLWNVLRGDMSLVGPRPERPEFHTFFKRHLAEFDRRLAVRGGVLGLAQVRGWRGDTAIEERLRCDLEYIDGWSVWKDILILLLIPRALLRRPRRSPMPRFSTVTMSFAKPDGMGQDGFDDGMDKTDLLLGTGANNIDENPGKAFLVSNYAMGKALMRQDRSN